MIVHYMPLIAELFLALRPLGSVVKIVLSLMFVLDLLAPLKKREYDRHKKAFRPYVAACQPQRTLIQNLSCFQPQKVTWQIFFHDP
jgi:hypothetical protein